MKKWLTGVMTVLTAVSLVVYIPTTEKQKRETIVAAVTRSQEDMIPPGTNGANDKVPDPNVMSVAVVSMYHGGSGSLMQGMDSLDTGDLDTQLLVDKLIKYGVPTNGTEAFSFDIEGGDKNTIGTLDLSQAESAGGYSDRMLLTRIDNTFTENFRLSELKLKVNGGNYEGDDAKQGDSDYPTYNVDYESAE